MTTKQTLKYEPTQTKWCHKIDAGSTVLMIYQILMFSRQDRALHSASLFIT